MTGKGALGGAVIVATIVGVIVTAHFTHKTTAPQAITQPNRSQAPAYAQTEPTVDALVLEHECVTPCSANIAWRFKIRTEGHPLQIQFKGVVNPVTFPGEGDFQAPEKMQSGETFFVSSEKEHPNVRVQVYRVVSYRR